MRVTIKPAELQEGDLVYFAQDDPDEAPCRLLEILERSEWSLFCRFRLDGEPWGDDFNVVIPFTLAVGWDVGSESHIEIEKREET